MGAALLKISTVCSPSPSIRRLEALMRLYEPQAALRPGPGQLVQGHARYARRSPASLR
jgi:hypothetical protein